MKTVLDILEERGFVRQHTDKNSLQKSLSEEKVVCYVGFDPTADSLHVGSLVPIMAIAHMQRCGHLPICIIGGGTTMIGDPSGKSELRRMMTIEEIRSNGEKILVQLGRYVLFGEEQGLFLNNADWLLNLNYIDFLRTIGKHFKVNEMIRSEAYKQRLDRQEGLSFIEFNYQLLQAYDFFVLNKKFNCTLQMGGDDQWGNILAGNDLIKKITGLNVHALTFPLLTTATGRKMGKTESGTIWLDASKTSSYEFFQYWINTDDQDVIKFLKFFTFIAIEEIAEFEKFQGADIRKAKETLAFEVTKLAHGEEEAFGAMQSSRAVFGASSDGIDKIPSTEISHERLVKGILITDLFCEVGLATSKSEAKRLANQGGAYVNDKPVSSSEVITEKFFQGNNLIIRSGKKKYHRIFIT